MLGGGLGKLAMDDYGFDTKLQGSVGLFADVPLFDGLSVRPEVTFSPYAYGSHQSTDVGETHGNSPPSRLPDRFAKAEVFCAKAYLFFAKARVCKVR